MNQERGTTAGASGEAGPWPGRVALHPVLLAVHPALALWAINVTEVLPGDAWRTIWMPAVAVAGLWVVTGLLLRSARRGAVLASITAVVVLNGGRPSGGEPGPTSLVAAAAIVLVGVLVVRWLSTESRLGPVTLVANVVALVLVALTIPPIASSWGGGARGAAPSDTSVAAGQADRDIWYLVPDRYPRADTLREVYDFDNDPFLDGLRDRGFQVADRALANYPKTAHSLASTWNLATLDDLFEEWPADGADWQPLYDLLRDHRLGRILTEAGYEYIHLGTWWQPTSTAASADRVLRADTATEFESVWLTQTLLPAVVRPSDPTQGDLSWRGQQIRYTSHQLDELDRLARTPSDHPRFILAHITLPHEPYVFAADGSLISKELADSRSRGDNMLEHLRYLNSRLERLVDQLLSGPPETWPVIVIQSDEGTHPAPLVATGPTYDWTTAPVEVLQEKLRTLSAILLPGSGVDLPNDLTGVDTWRLVLDATIGTNFGPVDDPPIQVFPGNTHLYDLHDVSDRVD